MRTAPSWATNEIPRAKFDRNAVEIPRYANIERAFESDIHSMISDHQSGRITSRELVQRFDRRLLQAETDAFVAGRRAAHDVRAELTPSELRMLDSRHAHNMRFWRGFVTDMDSGRGRMNYMRRGSLYAKSLWSVFGRGETVRWDQPDPSARFHWIFDPGAEHCADCIDRTRQSRRQNGFSYDEMVAMGWPGDGMTRCRVNCRCHVRVVHPRTSDPVRPIEAESAAVAPTPEAGLRVLQHMAGGPGFPAPLPTAGLASAIITPTAIASALVGSAGNAIGRLLPTIPNLLARPATVVGEGADVRAYVSPLGLTGILERGPDGVWLLVALFLEQVRS